MSREVAPYQDELWYSFVNNNEIIVRSVLAGIAIIEDGKITITRDNYEKVAGNQHINMTVDETSLVYHLLPNDPTMLPRVMYQESNETGSVTNASE